MKVIIDVPTKEFGIELQDNFQDFFKRVKVEIEGHLMTNVDIVCGTYELETVEMFLKAFKNMQIILDNGTNVDAIKDIFIAAQNDYEKSEDLLKQLFPIGTVVVYNKSLMKKLEKIYTMENLKGTQLYIVKERK